MDEPRFTLCLTVDRRLREVFGAANSVLMSVVSPGGFYIGLREDWYQAFVRAKLHSDGARVSGASHIILKIHFSAAGFMHYATTSAGRDYAFSPMLTKKYTTKVKMLIGRFGTSRVICPCVGRRRPV